MSHELRTPLNSILGVAQLLERDATYSPARRDLLAILGRSGRHLLELVEDVLDTARVESGQLALVSASFDLPSFLRDLEETLRPRAEGKGLRLLVHAGPELPRHVRSDPRRLRQILTNLLGNAIRYTNEGHVALTVRYRPDAGGEVEQPGGGRLAFEVSDTGIGIASENLERIFEPFVQLRPGRGASEGAGLGLTLSRGLVTLLGGQLSVQSALGQGTCCIVELPIDVPAAAEDAAPAAAAPAVMLAPDGPQYRILVVDDSEDSRVVLRQTLQQAGFTVLEASGGQEALDLAAAARPQLVLMDLRMPGMDGYEAVTRMRNGQRVPACGMRDESDEATRAPVIAVTAHATADSGREVLEAGFDDVIHKPFDAAELLEKIGKHLGAHYVLHPADAAIEERAARGTEAVTPAALAALPAAWLDDFSRALRRGRPAELRTLIDRIRPAHASLAETLAGLLRIHAFDTLLAATEAALKGDVHG